MRPGDDAVPTVVLPILHGPNGEDGTVQGLLELAGLPYVGAGVLGSSVAMDKAMAKTVLDAHGLAPDPVAGPRPVRGRRPRPGRGAAGGPGAGRVREAGQHGVVDRGVPGHRRRRPCGDALDLAFAYDELVVVEEGVVARELECGMLGNGSPRASVVGEIVPAADFYDYEDKYADGAAKTVVPADLPEAVADEVRDLALRTFRALRAEGMARVDIFWEGSRDGGPAGGRW